MLILSYNTLSIMIQPNSNSCEEQWQPQLNQESPDFQHENLLPFDDDYISYELFDWTSKKQPGTSESKPNQSNPENMHPKIKRSSNIEEEINKENKINQGESMKFQENNFNEKLQLQEQNSLQKSGNKKAYDSNAFEISYFDEILKELDLKRTQKKNTNYIKFIVNHFYANFIQRYDSNDPLVLSEYRQLHKKFRNRSIKSANRKKMEDVLVNAQNSQIFRKFMHSLLNDRQFLYDNIFHRTYVRDQNKKQYLLCSKVFSLRCRSKKLSDRVETR